MKISICILSALAGMILHVASSTSIGAAEAEEGSEMERIVGGKNAAEGQFPWSAALFRDGSFICTCSIIGQTTVLTAAHCVVNNGVTESASRFHAIANLRKSSPTVRIEFDSITPHPDYDESAIKNDIAVFKTTEPIPFDATVKPICIATNSDKPKDGDKAIAMGWGDTQRFRIFPILPDILQYVDQEVKNSGSCSIYYGGRRIEDTEICAGDRIKGICNGDSGGPLVLPGDVPVQIGVASFGNAITGCGLITPSVWTRVSAFTQFIETQAAGDQICKA